MDSAFRGPLAPGYYDAVNPRLNNTCTVPPSGGTTNENQLRLGPF
jgi:hypothetical protein